MSKERFIEKNFTPSSVNTINTIIGIVNNYAQQGYRLSVRQVYYQLVAKALIENTEKSYKRIVGLVSDARLAGLIDWDAIEDRNRETITPPMWKDPAQIIEAATRQFAIDRWEDQPNHVEVMVEKAALEGVLIPVCRELGIRFTSNRGYSSSSTMYETSKRIESMRDKGKNVFVLYLGDHDPSGIDMTRDVRDRIRLMSWGRTEVMRLALNMDQVNAWNPPENPAKTTDSRFRAYMIEFGNSSWELDAVEPVTLVNIVRDAVSALRDEDLYHEALEREREMRDTLAGFAGTYRNGKHKG